jgi:peptide/nickel transport system substrate-binding protein
MTRHTLDRCREGSDPTSQPHPGSQKEGTVQRKRTMAFVALVAALSLVAAGCSKSESLKRGGIYKMETDGFEWTNSFDPTGEYLGTAFMFYSNLLLRGLTGYKHKPGSEGGNDIIPDLATDLGTVSADGLTYTFKIKKGVKWQPPLNRDVTSKDVAYAFKRIGTASLAAQYGFYYEPIIKGLVEFKEGKATEISGITTPDDETIVIELTKPSGDLRFLLAMPAAAPIPEEVGKCFTKAGEYGRFLMSNGPYMIEGSDKIDITSCDTMKPASGFDPTTQLIIRRNPSYDASTDSAEARSNLIDGVDLKLNTNTEDIFNKIEAGTVDGEFAGPPAAVLQKYSTNPDLKDRLIASPADRTWYLTMNLTEPPFDDLHVRRAANFIVDKEGMLRTAGGPIQGEIAEHIVPPDVLGGRLRVGEFDPYATPNHAGDEAKAKEEMKQSKYDSDKDGVCDHPVCASVRHVTRNTPPFKDYAPGLEAAFKKIGIILKTTESANGYPVIQDPKNKVPISSVPGWGKDYANASTFMVLFDSRSTLASGNTNYSLVGISKEQAAEIGSSYVEGVPNVDGKIDECAAKSGDEQADCWAELDKFIMTDVVPWVPYRWAKNIDIISKNVTRYVYDQFSGEVALAHVALGGTE